MSIIYGDKKYIDLQGLKTFNDYLQGKIKVLLDMQTEKVRDFTTKYDADELIRIANETTRDTNETNRGITFTSKINEVDNKIIEVNSIVSDLSTAIDIINGEVI